MIEEWRPVPGYENRYEVSDQGRVRSLGLTVNARGGATAFRRGKVLAQAEKSNGYRQVTLVAADKTRKSWMVHQLVCWTFEGPPPFPTAQVRHRDGTRANNTKRNLCWGTAAENAADRERHGRFVCNLPGLEWCSS